MQNAKFGILSSSEDPQKLGDTVKSAILAMATLIIFVVHQYLHIDVSFDQITEVATEIGTIVSSLWFLYGLIKKLVIYIQEIVKTPTDPTV